MTGVIAVDSKGKLIFAESKFTVDVSNLVSDKGRRDGFMKRRVLQTHQLPAVTLVPTAAEGVVVLSVDETIKLELDFTMVK